MEPAEPQAADCCGGGASSEGGSAGPSPEARKNKACVAAYSHAALIDLMIAHPEWSQKEWARHFGYSQSWISQIICSDAFQEQLEKRRQEIVDPTLRATVQERFQANLRRSLDLIDARLHSGTVSDSFLLRTAEMSARSLGYGASRQVVSQAPVELNVHLHNMSERLTALLRGKRAEETVVIDAEGAS